MRTSESESEVSLVEKDLETKSTRKTTKGKTDVELISPKSEVVSPQSASSSGIESEYELSVRPAKSAKTKATPEPKISNSTTIAETEAKNEPSPLSVIKPASKSMRTKVAAESKISNSTTIAENEAKREPSPLPIKPASKLMRTKVVPESKTSKSAVPTPSAATSENEDDVSPPRAKSAPKSKAKIPVQAKTSKSKIPPSTTSDNEIEEESIPPPVKVGPKGKSKTATKENEDDVSLPHAKPVPKLKGKLPAEAKSKPSKTKIPTPPSSASDNEVEKESSPHVKKAGTKTKSKTAKKKTTKSKTPVIPNNIPKNKTAIVNNILEPVASTSKASTSRAVISKTARSREVNTDETQDEKMEKASTSEMVTAALAYLPSRKGTSLPAIKKYVNEHYDVDLKKYGKHINNYLKKSVEAGHIIQVTGKGASGSFKLPKPEKKSAKPKKVAKEMTPKLNKKAKMVVVSTPKRRSFKVVSSKRKSMSVPKATKSKKTTGETGESQIIEKKSKPAPKKGKRIKSSEETVEANEPKPKREPRAKRK